MGNQKSRKSKKNRECNAQKKKYKRAKTLSSNHYTEHQRLSSTNPTLNRGYLVIFIYTHTLTIYHWLTLSSIVEHWFITAMKY